MYNHPTIKEQHLSSLLKDDNDGNDVVSSSSSNVDFGVVVVDSTIDAGTENNNNLAAFESIVPKSYDTVAWLQSSATAVAQIHLANVT